MLESVLDTAVIPFRFTTEKKEITTQTVNAKRYVRNLIRSLNACSLLDKTAQSVTSRQPCFLNIRDDLKKDGRYEISVGKLNGA